MSPEQRERVKRIVEEAAEVRASERLDFIRREAAGDQDVAQEAESLIASETGPSVTSVLKASRREDAPTLQQGDRIDRYLLERPLNSGGFADAWVAEDTALSPRRVVLKILKQHEDQWFAEAFGKELDALARIDHPGVVHPLGSGVLADGRPYIVMQYVRGKTLRDFTAERPRTALELSELIRKIGAAVEAAHDANVLHCDLKPENIMVATFAHGDEPRLIDFGIARIRQSASLSDTTVHIAGTLRYMAPEQLRGKAGKASDVYALGLIFHELLTGSLPGGAGEQDDAEIHEPNGGHSPFAARPLPQEAKRLISAALAEDPASRPQSAGDFSRQLADAVAVKVAPVAGPRRIPMLLPAAAAGVLLVAALAFYPWGREADPYPKPRPAARHMSLEFRMESGAPAVTSDGAYLIAGPFRVRYSPAESGHLYLFSESANNPEGMTVLFPSPTSNDGSSFVEAGSELMAPRTSRFSLDPDGRQRFWLYWSASKVADLEDAARWANPRDKGAIGDASRRMRIRQLLRGAPRGSIALPGGIITAPATGPVALAVDLESR